MIIIVVNEFNFNSTESQVDLLEDIVRASTSFFFPPFFGQPFQVEDQFFGVVSLQGQGFQGKRMPFQEKSLPIGHLQEQDLGLGVLFGKKELEN